MMNTTLKNITKILAFSLVLAASLHSAQAATTTFPHTYVSGTGSDTNNTICSRTAPCATFQAAINNTSAGGVVTAIDAGDYGPVTITNQSVTIDGTGTQASIVTNSTDAITVNAGTGNTVILRHLTLTGVAGSGNGVTLGSGNLVVDDCKISGFVNNFGIVLGSSGNTVVEDTTVTGCTEGVTSSGTGLLSLHNVTLQGNTYGLDAEGGPTDISHSQITQNSFAGLYAYGVNGAGSGTLSASGCMVSGNGTGIYANTGSVIRLTNNDIFNNTVGIDTTSGGGLVSTAGNNRKGGNPTPGAPTPGKVIVVQ